MWGRLAHRLGLPRQISCFAVAFRRAEINFLEPFRQWSSFHSVLCHSMIRPHAQYPDNDNAFEVLEDNILVGEIFLRPKIECVERPFQRVRWALRITGPAGVMSRAYSDLTNYVGADIASDHLLSDEALKFWEKLRPTWPIRKYRFDSGYAAEQERQGERVRWEQLEQQGTVVRVLARNTEYFLTRDLDFKPSGPFAKLYSECPILFEWDAPAQLRDSLANANIDDIEELEEYDPTNSVLAATSAIKAMKRAVKGLAPPTSALPVWIRGGLARMVMESPEESRHQTFTTLVQKGLTPDTQSWSEIEDC